MSKFDDAYIRMQQFGDAMLSRLADCKANIDDIRVGKGHLLEGCPSRASAIDTFYLNRIKRDLSEINAAMKEAITQIWRECGEEDAASTSASPKPSQSSADADQLVRLDPCLQRPHVVILGAGASVAAFPTGDAGGKQLPVMANIVKILDLDGVVSSAGYDPKMDFESLYSQLHRTDPNSPTLRLIEHRVEEYFSSLRLPNHPTLYDVILLSLREKDAIFTFNWDPFLADTYARYVGKVKLPQIFHLHGNVRVGYCEQCHTAGDRRQACARCKKPLIPSRLLYPVEQKNYTGDPFISTQWAQARDFIKDTFLLTIFGYRAPKTDKEAMDILTEAWKGDGHEHPFEQIEIIDIRTPEELHEQWGPFSFSGHYETHRSILDSRLALYPRRSCEALHSTHVQGLWTSVVPWGWNLNGLLASIAELQKHEQVST
ncbi:MAG: hypothetical protein WCI73_15995 [Phycisphaerae bacterium]